MSWVELFNVFAVCHLTGDFVLQTNWQALNKFGGLGRDPERRRALASHVLTYTVSYIPALIWIAVERSVLWGLVAAVLIAVPHWIQDDGRLLAAFRRKVKKLGDPPTPPPPVYLMVDQSFHAVALFGVALLVGLA
ncbi:MAG: DUF3307 domain-containing protein [Solirubrobacterales bacterium]